MATRIVLGTCHHDCPDSCGWVATVEDGVATSLRGNPDHPYSQGELCPKVNHFLDRVYSPDRILHPLVRVGPKGEGRFEQASWEDALDLIARRTTEAIERHGGETVMPWSSAGNQSLLAIGAIATRFFSRIGATQPTGSLCGAVARTGTADTYGDGRGIDPADLRHSKFIVLWGTNTRMTNRHLWPFITEARRNGAVVVVIDPVRTMTARSADWFVQPLPGTDTALALAMMHVIIRDGLVDTDYVERYTTGFAELRDHVADWTPERAADVCGLDADEIERLAVAFATTKPAAIRTLIGAEHREHGAMWFRTIACLPLLTGAWRERGGGYARSVGTWFSVGVDELAVYGPSLAPPGTGPVRQLNTNHLGRTLTDPTLDPPVTVLFAWNGNPMVSVPNTELVRRGLLRDDLFTVVHEQFMTDTARYADVVLPAATQLEQTDVVPAWGHLYVGWNEAAIEPRGEAVGNTELFRRLSRALGFTEPELFESDESLIAAGLAPLAPDLLDTLRGKGFVRLPLPEDLRPYAEGGFATADGRALLYDTSRADGEPLPTHTAPAEGPGGDPGLLARFPLSLMTTKSQPRFINTSYSHLPKHGPAEGTPKLHISADDAATRGIAEGDPVVAFNDRGRVELTATISDTVRPGVVSIPFGWWSFQHPGGGVANSLTNDALTDRGGGVAFYDTLVEVARTP
jgi:anaerobic selenocysteine-containing dehydrogenase